MIARLDALTLAQAMLMLLTVAMLGVLIVLIGRLLQGFSAGVELGGVSVYLAEISTPGNRGFYTCARPTRARYRRRYLRPLGLVRMPAWDTGWHPPIP